MRISFNVNGARVGDEAYFLNFVGDALPASITVMDNIGLADRVHARSGGKTAVIHRWWHSHDGEWWRKGSRYLSPADWVDTHTRDGLKHIGRYVLNEPNGGDADGWRALTAWLIEVGRRLRDKGYWACLGNIGPGTFEADLVEQGVFDDYLRGLKELEPQGFTGGWHEYTAILLPFGVGRWPVSALDDRTQVQMDAWPYPVPRTRTADGKMPPHWHLRRIDWMDIRAQEIGAGVHRKDITEFGHDRMPDLTHETNHIYARLQARFGIPAPHTDMRGPLTLKNVWAHYFPQWSFAEAWMEQAKWADAIYPEDVRALHFFTWSHGAPDWDTQYGFNLGAVRDAHKMIVEYAHAQRGDAPVPLPEPEPEPAPEPIFGPAVDAILTQDMNLRYGPSMRAMRIETVPNGARVTYWLPQPAVRDAHYAWVRVEHAGNSGWMALVKPVEVLFQRVSVDADAIKAHTVNALRALRTQMNETIDECIKRIEAL